MTKKRILKFIAALAAALALLYTAAYYLMARYTLSEADKHRNMRGNAYAKALQVAFGEEDYFRETQTFASLLTDELRQQCLSTSLSKFHNKPKADETTHFCHLSVSSGHPINQSYRADLYDKHCNPIFLQRCNVLFLNDFLRDQPELMQAALDVVENPCHYFPSFESIKSKMNHYRSLPERNEKGNFNKEYLKWTRIRDYYQRYRNWLPCKENGEMSPYKFIISIGNNAESEIIIKNVTP